MTRILDLQRMDFTGVGVAPSPGDVELSTCSYLFCGNSTYSCETCCGVTCEFISDTTMT